MGLLALIWALREGEAGGEGRWAGEVGWRMKGEIGQRMKGPVLPPDPTEPVLMELLRLELSGRDGRREREKESNGAGRGGGGREATGEGVREIKGWL